MLLSDFWLIESDDCSLSFEYSFLNILSLTSGKGIDKKAINSRSSYSSLGSRFDSLANIPYIIQSVRRSSQ